MLKGLPCPLHDSESELIPSRAKIYHVCFKQLYAIDAYIMCHTTFSLWCHFCQCPWDLGFAPAERAGQGEVGTGGTDEQGNRGLGIRVVKSWSEKSTCGLVLLPWIQTQQNMQYSWLAWLWFILNKLNPFCISLTHKIPSWIPHMHGYSEGMVYSIVKVHDHSTAQLNWAIMK